MRYISAFAVAALAVAFSVSATPAAAQQVPSGSYQQTCRDVGARGSTLYAKCKDANSNWQDTQLRDFDRCGGDIQNINGNLQCANGNGNGYGNGYGREGDHGRDADRDRDHDHDGDRDRDRRNNYPPGSYSQTCQNIQVNGNTLQASCQKRNGKTKNTSLHDFRNCRDIANDNGKLRCTR